MKKIRFISLLLALVMTSAIIFTACGGKEENAGEGTYDPNQKVTMTFSWWGDTARHEATMNAINLWNDQNPNIQIKPYYSGWDGYHNKIGTQFAGGNAPEIIQLSTNYLQDYALTGQLADLTEYKEKYFKNVDQSDVMWEDLTFDGKIYGVVAGLGGGALMYNKDVLDEYDIDYPTDDETDTSMYERYKEITEKSGGTVWGAQDPMDTSAAGYVSFLNARGVYGWNEDGTDTYLDSEEAIEIIKEYEKYRAEGIVVPRTETLTPGQSYIGIGACAYAGVAASTVVNEQANTEAKLGVVMSSRPDDPYPDNRYVGMGLPIVINADCKYKEAALTFLEWFLTDPEAGRQLGLVRGVLPSQAQRDAVYDTLEGIEKEVADVVDRTIALGIQPEVIEKSPKNIASFDDVFTVQKEKYLFDNCTLEEFLKEACKNGRPLLKD